MGIAKDITLGPDDDLFISNAGDFVARPSDQQHIDLHLTTSIGEWRGEPLVGVGITQYINGAWGAIERQALRRNIKLKLEADNYTDVRIDLGSGADINIDAQRPEVD